MADYKVLCKFLAENWFDSKFCSNDALVMSSVSFYGGLRGVVVLTVSQRNCLTCAAISENMFVEALAPYTHKTSVHVHGCESL